jgi:hypothetical protein
MMQFLLMGGANPNADSLVNREFSIVVARNDPDIVRLLLEYGANYDVAIRIYGRKRFDNTAGYAALVEFKNVFDGPRTLKNLSLDKTRSAGKFRNLSNLGALKLPTRIDTLRQEFELAYKRRLEESNERIEEFNRLYQEETQPSAAASSSSSSSSTTTSSSSFSTAQPRQHRRARRGGHLTDMGDDATGRADIPTTPPTEEQRGRVRPRSPLSTVSSSPSGSPASSPGSEGSENDPNKKRRLMALIAAKYGDHESLHELLSETPKLVHEAVSKHGYTLLDYAQKYKHHKTVVVIKQFISATLSN